MHHKVSIVHTFQVQYGQEVLTLGYPLGMESIKLTEGIISGRQDAFFQTDAPLNVRLLHIMLTVPAWKFWRTNDQQVFPKNTIPK